VHVGVVDDLVEARLRGLLDRPVSGVDRAGDDELGLLGEQQVRGR
jgi:hypothetical protein